MQRKQCPRCGRYLKPDSNVHWPCVLARIRQVALLPTLVVIALVVAGFVLLRQDGDEGGVAAAPTQISPSLTATIPAPEATVEESPTPPVSETPQTTPSATNTTTPSPSATTIPQPRAQSVFVNFPVAPLYPEARFSDEVVGWATRGATLAVVAIQGEWYQARLPDGDLGWIWVGYVTFRNMSTPGETDE